MEDNEAEIFLRDAARKKEYPPGTCNWKVTVDGKPILDPDVEDWIQTNLDGNVNLKSRLAAIFVRTTKPEIQQQVIGTYYNQNIGSQDDTEQLARAVLERVITLVAANGVPVQIFTPRSMLEAAPDQYQPQQYFHADNWKKSKAANKIPVAKNLS